MVIVRLVAGMLLAFPLLYASVIPKNASSDPAANIRLTPRHLHRLQLERERQTPRWLAFENRVQTAPDSPQRGFELALYYAVAQDAERGKQAVIWAAAHPEAVSQRAVVAAWCPDLLSEQQRTEWTRPANDQLDDASIAANELAAAILLSLPPQEFEHPAWQTHIYALRFVSEHPNLPNAQFLQSWVLQSNQTLREGPGVGYEFLWADPYLPGVSYQNMDPWIYEQSGHLFARTNWTMPACWINISVEGVQDVNCPSDWRTTPTSFGHLTLVPMTENCIDLDPGQANTSTILWKLPPDKEVVYRYQKKQQSSSADRAGLVRTPNGLSGKVCVAR